MPISTERTQDCGDSGGGGGDGVGCGGGGVVIVVAASSSDDDIDGVVVVVNGDIVGFCRSGEDDDGNVLEKAGSRIGVSIGLTRNDDDEEYNRDAVEVDC